MIDFSREAKRKFIFYLAQICNLSLPHAIYVGRIIYALVQDCVIFRYRIQATTLNSLINEQTRIKDFFIVYYMKNHNMVEIFLIPYVKN